jgi:heme/copper-type cytochrome/quinol oxidase subunit 2
MTGVNVNIDTGDLVKALNDTLTFLKGCGIEVVKNVDQAVKFGWPIMVKQAQTQGQIGIILSIIFALVSVLFIIFTISVYKRAENAPLKSDQALTYSGATILCALLFIISFIISIDIQGYLFKFYFLLYNKYCIIYNIDNTGINNPIWIYLYSKEYRVEECYI